MSRPDPATGRSRRWIPLTAYLGLWGTYFSVLWSHQLVADPRGWIAGWIGTWADGAVHLTYMSVFAYRDQFPTSHPLYRGEVFSYPFVTDALGGLMVRAGMSIPAAYELLGWALTLVLLVAAYLHFRLVFRDAWVACIAPTLWLLGGGLGGVWVFRDIARDGLFPTLAHLPREYTHIGESGIEWLNTVSGALVPQRAMLLGVPLGLYVLTVFWQLLAEPERLSRARLFGAGVALGILPITHPHTLIMLGAVLGWILVLTVRTNVRRWLWILTPAALLGVPLMLTFILPATGNGFFRFQPGWLAATKEINWLWFWFLNWGLMPLAAAAGLAGLGRLTGEAGAPGTGGAGSKQRLFLVPFGALFIASNVFLFQPYDYDNAKILSWVYLVLCGPAAVWLVAWWRAGSARRLTAIAVAGVLTLSGALDVVRLLDFERQARLMFTAEDLQLAEYVRAQTSPRAVFLTAGRHNHPISALTGRPVVMGYPGWLGTYGIQYRPRQRRIRDVYRGREGAIETLRELGVDYIVLGPAELADFRADRKFFETHFRPFTRTRNYTVYRAASWEAAGYR